MGPSAVTPADPLPGGQQQPAHHPAPASQFWVSRNQKRQDPHRLWVWRMLAERERLMCLVVEQIPSAACMASVSAVLSSSRSSRSSWMERRCPLTAQVGVEGGQSAGAAWAEEALAQSPAPSDRALCAAGGPRSPNAKCTAELSPGCSGSREDTFHICV